MNVGPALRHAQARIQARVGGRPPPTWWRELDGPLDRASVLFRLREREPWRHRLSGVEAKEAPGLLDATLQRCFEAEVERVSAWAPAPWRPAVAWVGTLPLLPARADPMTPDSEAWLRRWQARWPRGADADATGLHRLVAAADALRSRLAETRVAGSGAWETAEREAVGLCRRWSGRPVVLFAHLALAWIDCARVRGLLDRRFVDRERRS